MKKNLMKEYSINVIMYHYVREIKNSKYPNLKGLEYKNFEKQIKFFIKNFNILSYQDLLEIIETKKIPKKPSILLTFDDGYIDHFKYVFPLLKKKKISGIFYPPKKVVENEIVLDVNKIHFILEKETDKKKIIREIKSHLNKNHSIKYLEKVHNISLKSRFDDKETILIKRLLQYFLPEKIRDQLLNILFKKIVNESIEDFSKKLYMNKKNLREMYSEKMTFGAHGVYHKWLEYLEYDEQEKEIKEASIFFKKIIPRSKNLSFCYPYGSFNKNTIKLLRKHNFNLSFTSKPQSITKKNISNKFEYPRFDTNDFLI